MPYRSTFDGVWRYNGASLADNQLVRQFIQAGATINLIGPQDYTNPMIAEDVNGSGDVTAGDALIIINELGVRRYSDADTDAARDIASINTTDFQFFDVSGESMISALDALRVINKLAANSSAIAERVDPSLWTLSDKSESLALETVDEIYASTSLF